MRVLSSNSGQMTVELAVTIPVMLALTGIAINLMVFLGDCARFDRLAPEMVRVYAASPGYEEYSSSTRAQAVQSALQEVFASQSNLSVEVSVASAGSQGDVQDVAGIAVSFLFGTERYTCTLYYRPWGFGDSFFGISFTGIPHSMSYVVAPFRPGVLI